MLRSSFKTRAKSERRKKTRKNKLQISSALQGVFPFVIHTGNQRKWAKIECLNTHRIYTGLEQRAVCYLPRGSQLFFFSLSTSLRVQNELEQCPRLKRLYTRKTVHSLRALSEISSSHSQLTLIHVGTIPGAALLTTNFLVITMQHY